MVYLTLYILYFSVTMSSEESASVVFIIMCWLGVESRWCVLSGSILESSILHRWIDHEATGIR